MIDNTCVICGDIIPEGRQVCPVCEMKFAAASRAAIRKKVKSIRDQAYNKKNIVQKLITFNRKNPEEMILFNYLIGKGNINGYIKQLIREDMAEQTPRRSGKRPAERKDWHGR